MTDVTIRRAVEADIDALVEMRRDFTFEDYEPDEAGESATYESECRAFLREAIAGGRWQVWVAEIDGSIISHAFVALVDKVPRPVRERRHIAYLTNVYTRPDHRGRVIGARLIEQAQAAAREADVELMLVWPSEASIAFYERLGFAAPGEPFVWKVER